MRFIGKQSDKIGDATKITLGSTGSSQTTDLGSKDIVSLFSAGNGTSITVSNFESGELFQTIVAFNGINASTSAKGVAQFSSDNFAASSGTITIKDGGVDLTAEVTGVLPSANLDADTAHLSTDQTFTGTKTFDETISGNISGSAATVTSAAQTNITSLGTLTSLDVDAINLNTRDITITGSTDDTFSIVTGVAGATTLTTHDEAGTAGHFEIAADGNITLDAAGDIALEAGGADVDITADHVTITSSSASDPTLKLKSTTNDANGCQIQLRNDKGAAGADGDGIGSIRFIGDDAAQTQTEFGKIICQVSEADDSDEAGKMRFMVAESDGTTTALTTGLSIEGEHATDGQVDVTIAAGSASTTTVAGDLTVSRTLSVVNRIELGDGSSAQTDTTIARSAAGTVTIEGETVITAATLGYHGSATRIKILPRDFMPDDSGRPVMIEDDQFPNSMYLFSNASANMYAFVDIPTGFKATHVKIEGSDTSQHFSVYEGNIDAKAIAQRSADTDIGTEADITDVTSSTTNYLVIRVESDGTADQIFGGYVTIAAV